MGSRFSATTGLPRLPFRESFDGLSTHKAASFSFICHHQVHQLVLPQLVAKDATPKQDQTVDEPMVVYLVSSIHDVSVEGEAYYTSRVDTTYGVGSCQHLSTQPTPQKKGALHLLFLKNSLAVEAQTSTPKHLGQKRRSGLHVNTTNIIRAAPCAATAHHLFGTIRFQSRKCSSILRLEITNFGRHDSDKIIPIQEQPLF
jgi:hypothetical protein